MRGPIPFRFENMWLKEEGFKKMVRDRWHSRRVSGTSNYVVLEKLKTLQIDLKNLVRLKISFSSTFQSWARLIPNVDLTVVRILLCILSSMPRTKLFWGDVCFLFALSLFLGWLVAAFIYFLYTF